MKLMNHCDKNFDETKSGHVTPERYFEKSEWKWVHLRTSQEQLNNLNAQKQLSNIKIYESFTYLIFEKEDRYYFTCRATAENSPF